jgi:hypothetical protein
MVYPHFLCQLSQPWILTPNAPAKAIPPYIFSNAECREGRRRGVALAAGWTAPKEAVVLG